MKQKRTAEEIAALIVLRKQREEDDREALRVANRRASRRAKRRQMGDGELVRALELTPAELTGLAQARIRRIVAEIVADEAKLTLCEKALVKVPRGWDKVEMSSDDDSAPREAAE